MSDRGFISLAIPRALHRRLTHLREVTGVPTSKVLTGGLEDRIADLEARFGITYPPSEQPGDQSARTNHAARNPT